MGRPKKPLQVIMGNDNSRHLSKAEIIQREEEEIKVDSDNVEAPDYLPSELIPEYEKLKNELLKAKLIANLDVDLLARYVILRDEFIGTTYKLREQEIMINGEYNSEYKNLLNAQVKLNREIRSVSNDLGLSLGARLKLILPKSMKEDKENKTEGEKLFGDII